MKKALLFVAVVAFWAAIFPFYLVFLARRALGGAESGPTRVLEEMQVLEEKA